MWVQVDEDVYVNDELFSDIRKNFASKVAASIINVFHSTKLYNDSILARQPIHDLVDKSKELRVLDGKAAQNFGKNLFNN